MFTLKKRYHTVQPLWKEWEQKAKREGPRKTVFSMNGDRYIGEWSGDRKHGKGTCWYAASRERYKGDWFRGQRSGHGTLDIPHPSGKGGWRYYAGEWKHDKFDGYGTCYFTNGDVYEGDWKGGHMCGWGSMNYSDKSVYEGEWAESKRNGLGTLTSANGDKYEGWWKNDLKHKNGKLTMKQKERTFEGYWMDDFLRCGYLAEDNDKKGSPVFQIPETELSDVNEVLRNAKLQAKITYGTHHLHPITMEEGIKRRTDGAVIIEEGEEVIEESEGELIEGEYIPEEEHMLGEHEAEHEDEEEQVSEESEEMTEPSSASSSITLSD